MSHLALRLFIVAIFHNGILKLAHADEVTTEPISKTNAKEEVKTANVVDKGGDEVVLKEEPEVKSGKPSKAAEPKEEADDTGIQKTAGTPIEEEDDKVIELNKDGDTETIADTPVEDVKVIKADKDGKTPDQFFNIKHTQVFLDIPKKIIGPAAAGLPGNAQTSFGGQIGAAMGKTINTVKYLASAPFGFLRSAVNSAFENVQ